MRVGIVCPYSFDVPGGVQEHVVGLADHLRGRGHDVAVLAPGAHRAPGFTSAGPAVAVRYNGSVARLAYGPRARARTARWLAAGRFDVVHLHEPLAPSVSAIAGRQARVPTVATFHTAIDRSLALRAARPAARTALERVGARIAVSPAARSTIERHLGAGAVVIPNGVRTADFVRDPDPRWTGTPQAPTVAFLGRTDEPRKGLPVLLAAWPGVIARHPGARLLVAGRGGARSVAGLPADVAASVEVLGPVDDADRAALLASADVYVAPNTGGESFGIILVEAMAAGARVVASDLPAFAAVLGTRGEDADSGGEAGGGTSAGRLFATADAVDLARVVVDELDELTGPDRRPARARTARAARARAARYDWAAVGTRIEAVYETVLLAAHGDITADLARPAAMPGPAARPAPAAGPRVPTRRRRG